MSEEKPQSSFCKAGDSLELFACPGHLELFNNGSHGTFSLDRKSDCWGVRSFGYSDKPVRVQVTLLEDLPK